MPKKITGQELYDLIMEMPISLFPDLSERHIPNLDALANKINENYVEGFDPKFHHNNRGTNYEVLGRGLLQNATNHAFEEGDKLVAYIGEGKDVYFRYEPEFDDGRFSKIT